MRRPIHLIRLALAASALACAGGAAGCTCGNTGLPSSTSSAPSSAASAPPLARSSRALCPDPQAQGWTRWEIADAGPALYAAPSPAAMPAAISWEPCPAETPIQVSCRREQLDPAEQPLMVLGVSVDVAPGGKPVGSFARRCGDWSMLLFSELDGEVLAAIAAKSPDDLSKIQLHGVRQGHWLASLYHQGKHAFFGGSFVPGAPTRIAAISSKSEYAHAYASERYVWIQWDDVLRGWNGEQVKMGRAPGVLGATLWGPYALFPEPKGEMSVGMLWDGARGAQPWIWFERMRVSRFATDGKDVAMVLGTRAGSFLIASPFSERTQGLAPRRLAPLYDGSGDPVVGCGMAAVRTGGQETRVVRIQDGQTWTVSSKTECSTWCFEPLAVTCDELIGAVHAPDWAIVRVKLSDLGEGKKVAPVPLPVGSLSLLE